MIEYRYPETWTDPIPSAKKISRLVFDAGLVQLIPFVIGTIFDSVYGAWSRIGMVEVGLLSWSLFGGAGLLFASSAMRTLFQLWRLQNWAARSARSLIAS